MKASDVSCWWSGFWPAASPASLLSVRCMRSWRPASRGSPGLVRSSALTKSSSYHAGRFGPERGSAAGSLVSYCLGITNLDPLKHGLIFERFRNIDRVSMPDIDCDFSVEGREKVINYVSKKYGVDRVAQIITFTTMASKAAIRDVGRVLEVPLRDTDRLAKLVPVWQGRSKSLDDAIKEVPEFREAYESSEEQKRLVDVARALEGVACNGR